MATATTSPAKNLQDAFRQATLYSDDRIYKLLRFPRPSMEFALDVWTKANTPSSISTFEPAPFGAFLVDKDEITMMMDSAVYTEHCNNRGESDNKNPAVIDNGINYRLFTFDNVVMDPSLVGFMAVVTKVLAENQIFNFNKETKTFTNALPAPRADAFDSPAADSLP